MSRRVAYISPLFVRLRHDKNHWRASTRQCSALWCVLAAFLSLAARAGGQVNPGMPSFSAFDSHTVDTINLQNLNILLNVPVRSKAGAFPFNFSLVGQSYVFASGGSWSPYAGALNVSMNGVMSGVTGVIAISTNARFTLCPDGVHYTNQDSGWYLQFPDKTIRWLPPDDLTDLRTDGSGLSCYNTSFSDQVTDDSGYTATISQDALTAVYDSSGMSITSYALKDSNNNSISISTSGDIYTDTLGVTALTVGRTGEMLTWTDVNGGSPEVTQTLTVETVRSAFGCSGISEYNRAISLPTNISYPDGTSLGIAYEGTPGYSGDYTGRLGQLTLRTGGTITYSYPGSNNGINCTHQTPIELKRVTSDGTTTYSLTYFAISDTNYGVDDLVVDNGGNQTIYQFTGLTATGNAALPVTQALTEVLRYQGPGTQLLTTDVYCYNGATTGCNRAVVSLPVTEIDVYHTINGMSTSSRSQVTYDNYGNVLVSAQYDFGATTPTYQSTIAYGSWNGSTCVAVSSTVHSKPCTVTTVQSGSTISQSRFSYDSHGNLLTAYRWNGSSWLSNTTPNSYNSNGMPNATYDIANNKTTYDYNGTGGCNSVFPTSVTAGGLTVNKTWNCTGGVVLTNADASGNTTIYGYQSIGGTADPYWRLGSVTDPLNNEVWQTPMATTINNTFTFNSGASISNITKTVDGYGRPINAQKQQSPTATNYDTTSTEYGWSGNYKTITSTLPCTAVSGSQCSFSSGATVTETDPLGRPYTVTDGGGGTLTNTYTQNDVLSTVGPAPTGENTKQLQSQYDGLGRVTSSCKISSTVSGNVSCGQNTNTSAKGVLTTTAYTSGTGYQTTTLTRGSQSRSQTVDALGRVTKKVTPEAGLLPWNYYYDTACSSSYTNVTGRLAKTVDPNGNTLCYSYDSLGRVLLVNANGTTCRHFYYDNSTGYSGTIPSGISLSNQYGRLVEAATDACSSGTLITDEWFAYDKNGNQADLWEMTPHSTQYYHSHVGLFYGNGFPTSVALASPSLYTMTYGLDGEGRLNTLTDTTANQDIITAVSYFPATTTPTVSLTGSDNDAYTLDPNTGRVKKFVFTVGSNNLTGTLNWNPNGTLGYLTIADGFNSGGSLTCYSNNSGAVGYGYDDLARLVEFDCGSGNWGQQFAYDQYDNLTKTVLSGRTGTTWNPVYSSTTNHCNSPCTYDSNGDMTGDGNDVYGWNEFSKIMWTTTSGTPTCGTSGRCAVYDAFGRMVESSTGGTSWKEYWYTQGGGKMVMSGTTMTDGRWPANAGTVETVGTSCCVYLHSDWIGNARVVSSTSNNTVTADQAYTPYGEIFNIFGANNGQYQVFADMIADLAPSTTTPIMWDTPNRELSYTGRWLSPDPAGSGWNQYAYPTNPNSFSDPTGLDPFNPGPYRPGGSGPGARYTLWGCSDLVGCVVSDGGSGYDQLDLLNAFGTTNVIFDDYGSDGGTVAEDSGQGAQYTGDYEPPGWNGGQQVQDYTPGTGSDSSTPSWLSSVLYVSPSPAFLMGCSGPGIPCYVVKTQNQPPASGKAFRGYNYKVIDIDGNAISGQATEWLQELGVDSQFFPGTSSTEGSSWTDLVGWDRPVDSSPDAFISAQAVSFQVGGEGPSYLVNGLVLHGASVGGGIFSSFANVSYSNPWYPLP